MLGDVFKRPYVCRRLRSSLLATAIGNLCDRLSDRGFARRTIQGYLQAVEHFGHWLSRQHTFPKSITDESVEGFLNTHIRRCRCAKHHPTSLFTVRAALRHLVRMLRERGDLPPKGTIEESGPIAAMLDQYHTHLRDACGVAEATIQVRTRVVRHVSAPSLRQAPLRPARIRPQDLCDFIANYVQGHKPATVRTFTTSLRSFLRYLQFTGQVAASLVYAVPTIAQWKFDRLPRVMGDEQLAAFLGCFDRSSASGRRDYAMALFLVELGLRAGEVAKMQLEDIDWQKSVVKIAAGKSRRDRLLPLTQRVGKAVASYLRYGRPTTSAGTVFVRHKRTAWRSAKLGTRPLCHAQRLPEGGRV